jgi:hypothetical protein
MSQLEGSGELGRVDRYRRWRTQVFSSSLRVRDGVQGVPDGHGIRSTAGWEPATTDVESSTDGPVTLPVTAVVEPGVT